MSACSSYLCLSASVNLTVLFLWQVVAFDSDEGANGTVRYWARARGAARGLLRVHAASGRLYMAPRLALAPGDSYDVTVSR